MPEPPAADALAFRPLRAADLPTLHRWLSNPAVYRWYGGAAPTQEAVAAKYGPRIAGDSPVRPFLILHDGAPIGYIQVYPVAPFPTHAAHTGDDAGAVAVDMLLGEDAARGRGLGSAALRRFLGTVAFSHPAVTRCFIDPHPDNAAAIRAYRRAGFRPLRRVEPPLTDEPCLLMAIAREELTGMPGEDAIRIVAWSLPEIAAARGAIREIFAAAFGMADDEAAAYTANLDRHGGYPGFRFLAALDPASDRPLGFVYGYSSRPGQWFHDTIRPGSARKGRHAGSTTRSSTSSSPSAPRRKGAASAAGCTTRSWPSSPTAPPSSPPTTTRRARSPSTAGAAGNPWWPGIISRTSPRPYVLMGRVLVAGDGQT